ncbi:MAG: Ala-tRNA(Pro) deacylase [Glaciecola sp.]|jgi:Ala-tRNA(Pro) deacylase
MSQVTDYLRQRGIDFELLSHPPTHSAREEARALGLSPLEVLKVLVLDFSEGHALAIIPSHRRLDLARARTLLGDRHTHLASEQEMARDLPEFELGAVPALPNLTHLPILIDPEVFRHTRVTFSAGVQHESVRLDPHRAFEGGKVTVAMIAQSFDHGDDDRDGVTARPSTA